MTLSTFRGGPLDGRTLPTDLNLTVYVHREPVSGVVDESGAVINMAYQECLYVRSGDEFVYTRVSG